jgi:hypothetical protein
MNYIGHVVATLLSSGNAFTQATTQAIWQAHATLEERQRCRAAPYLFRLALFASVCGALALSASRAEAAQASDITFGNNSVSYTYAGDTAVLTATTVHNYSATYTSAALRMELWALPAPYAGGDTQGYKLAEYPLAALAPGAEYTNVDSGTIAFTPPPVGTWYFVMFLGEYTGAPFNDGYTIDDWFNFSTAVVFGSPLPTTLAVEYYYSAWDFYFVTAFPDEIAALDGGAFGGAWQRTEQAFQVWPQPNAGSTPTCRFFSIAFAPKSSHFYTPFPAECQYVETNPADVAAWEFESIAFYIQLADPNGNCLGGTIPLYRLYNNGIGGAPNHRYTIDTLILNQMIAQGWVFEGNGNTKVFACVPG